MQSLFPAPSPIPPSGTATLVRVLVLIAVASVIWVPIGVWVGLRPGLARIVQPVAQFLAAFPANLLFPVAVSAIVAFALNPDIWLSPLMACGSSARRTAALPHWLRNHNVRRPACESARPAAHQWPVEATAGNLLRRHG